MSSAVSADDDAFQARIELGRLLAGIRDLEGDFGSTETLALHFLARRGAAATVPAVLADVEACLRGSAPQRGTRLPATPRPQLQATLARARRDYNRALTRHLEHARLTLDNAVGPAPAAPAAQEKRR